MSTDIVAGARSHLRIWLAVFGALSIIAGALILAWPVKSGTVVAVAAAYVLGVYAIVVGIAYFFSTFFTAGISFWGRVLRAVVGVLSVVAGVIILANPVTSAVFAVWFVVIMIAVAWIADGISTFANLSEAGSKGWAIFYAIISIIAGIILIFSPLYSGLVLWWVVGLTAVIWGVVQLITAIRFTA